ncbi:substrate-binding periplasmic protein [Marinobacter sp. SS21]|uniref:substrate-binding periplasmic protein n=1 Tax=Marinobacter sp. SS21 TaxID=2979460 RepID=UPI00232B0D01|nr:transporter substrate-binding domain-containing protein [Marinobacter sp. SS21]MDC0662654.1 transporter substrate-binding domain-containing protein [Marinobacter sp. SS21]
MGCGVGKADRGGFWGWLLILALIPVALQADDGETGSINYLVVDSRVGPFQLIREGASDGGIISDIVDELFHGIGMPVRHHVLPVNRLLYGVAQGQFKHWVAYDAPVWDSFPGRGEYARQPLFQTRHIMLTCNDEVASPVRSMADLEGLSIATLRGFQYLGLDQAAEQGRIRPVPVDDFESGLALVSLQRVDGFVEMASRLRFYLSGFGGDTSCMREVDVSAIIPNYSVYLSMDRQLPAETRRRINQQLDTMARTGRLSQIWRRYVPDELPQEINAKAGH